MQTWARRGLQTALVTGGLLMLGTGIASAHENVSPDRPASPIDGGVSVPVNVGNNAVGTPFGQKNLPSIDRTISTDQVTGALPQGGALPAGGVTSAAGNLPVALSKVAPAATKALPSASKAVPALGKVPGVPGVNTQAAPLAGDPLLGNRGRADVVVPIDISGNAIAVGGPATGQGDSNQTVARPDPVISGWDPGSLTNNVVAVNYAAPVQIDNNAVSAVGTAHATGTANQSASTGGDITTNGNYRSLAGNVVAGQFATPVQVAGNAVAGGGLARSDSTNNTAGHSNGSILTDGSSGSGSGNVAGVPLAVPAEVDGQAIGAAGTAAAATNNSATTTAGSTDRLAPRGSADRSSTLPGYVQTSGLGGVLSGNGATPSAANPVEVAGNAVGAVANTGTAGSSTNNAQAGGFTTTNGSSSTGSGNLVGPALANPVHVFGNGVAGVGNSSGVFSNSENAIAGGISYANGNNSVLGGNDATAPVAGSTDVFSSGVAALGNAAGTGANDVMATTGGYAGTNGSGGSVAGNILQTPVALPAEAFGNGASAGGNAAGTVPAESKTITAGGNSNTNDDFGTLSSNVVDGPTAGAAQVFGNAVGLVANTAGSSDSMSTVTAGGNATGTGRQGTGSGNIVQLPTALPAQVFNSAVTGVGNGSAVGSNATNLGAGGDATADGSGGSLAGNVVNLPNSGPAQVFGNGVSGVANDVALTDNSTTTWAGGDTSTDGTAGSGSGNVVSAQVIHTAQVFGDAAAAGGNALGHATNELATTAGGSTSSHGDWGAVSGDLVNVPATAIAQVFASGVAAAGNTGSVGVNSLTSQAGGPATTSGHGSLAGLNGQVPVGVVAQVFKVPVQVLGKALVAGSNSSQAIVGERPAAVDVPLSLQSAPTAPQLALPNGTEALLPIGALPNLATLPLTFPHLATLPGVGNLPGTPALSGVLSGLPATPGLPGLSSFPATQGLPNVGGFPNLPGVSSFPNLPSLPGVPSVSSLPGVPGVPAVPSLPGVSALPSLPGTPLTGTHVLPGGTQDAPAPVNLPGVPAVPSLPSLPGVGSVTEELPGINGFSGDLPLTGQLPTTQGLPEVPLTTPATLPITDGLPTLPVDGLPIGQGEPALPVGLPEVPQIGTLPTVSSALLPGSSDLLPNQGSGLQSQQALPVVGSLPGASTVPGIATVPAVGDLSSAPVVATSLPTVGQLPTLGADNLVPAAALPTSGLPTGGLTDATQLPSLGQLTSGPQDLPAFNALPGFNIVPGFSVLPDIDSLPMLPSMLTLPAMPALPFTPHLPATQNIAVTPGQTGSQLPDVPAVASSVPNPTDIKVGGAPVSSLGDVVTGPLAGAQPGALGSMDVPALNASDAAAGSLRSLAGQGLDGVQLPSV